MVQSTVSASRHPVKRVYKYVCACRYSACAIPLPNPVLGLRQWRCEAVGAVYIWPTACARIRGP